MVDMIRAAMPLCKNAHVPVIAGIFTTSRLHQVAEDIGFRKYHEIEYNNYKIEGKVVFDDVDCGNHGAALMAYRVPGVEELEELEAQHSSRFNIQSLEEGADSYQMSPQIT